MPTAAGQLYSHSVEEQAAAVDPWDVTLRQVSPGPFHGSMQFASLGDILIYRDCWSQHTVARGALPRGYFMLGTGARPHSGINWCGDDTDAQLLALTPPDTEVDFIMPAATPYVAILLPIRYLHSLSDGEISDLPSLSGCHHFRCNLALGNQLIARLNRMINTYADNPERLSSAAERKGAAICLLDDLAEMGFGRTVGRHRVRLSARRQTLRRALEHGESVRDKTSVPKFARQLAVSQRSLELVFREFLGITPRQYLNYRRMHGVHRELQQRPPQSRCVTQAANTWGFSELGRFAGEYKQLFDELPSATLNRAPLRAPQSLRDVLQRE